MARSSTNNASASNAQSTQEQASVSDANAANVAGITVAMPSSTTMGVTAITSPIITPVSMMTTAALTNVNTMASMPPILGPTSPLMANPLIENMPFSMSGRAFPYGMPTALMAGLQTNSSTFADNAITGYSPTHSSSEGIHSRNAQPNLTTTSLLALRQQMDDSNHDMVNMLTQQIGTVFNPLIQNTNNSYQMLATQMGRIADFFGTPPVHNQQIPQIQNVRPVEIPLERPNNAIPINQGNQGQQHVVEEPMRIEAIPDVVLVNRNQNADEVVRQVQQNNFGAQNNLANLVENILAQNGLNLGLHRPNFVSPLSEYTLQTELPRGWKIPKFTKFAGETSESTVEHVARYLTEAGDIAHNENLRMKYFPNSLTKNAFTWFTTLPPNSIFSWSQLEKAFHEQFYMGQCKISLKELASVRRKGAESIDDYLNRFRLLKARCFTQVPEHELVEMAAGGLDYSIRKKLDTLHLRDMAQLADRVRQVERLKAEKARTGRFQNKKEKVAYVETNDSDQEFDISYEDVEEEVNIAELKSGPPYTCKLLKPSNGKNPVEPKNDKFVAKTYTYDVSKCDEIFDLLVADGQILVPKGLKVPPLEQRQKRGFCKFHNFLGHNTSRCVIFRDLVQKALNEGRLKFGDKSKPPMKIDADPLPTTDALLVEVDINVVEITGVVAEDAKVEKAVDKVDVEMVTEDQYAEKMKTVYPMAEEELIDFLNRCKINNTEVMLCPRCSSVFDKEAAKNLEGFKPQLKRKGKWVDKRPKFSYSNRGIQYKVTSTKNPQKEQIKTYVPPAKSPVEKWVHSGGKSTGYYPVYYAGKNAGNQQKSAKMVKGSTSATGQNKAFESNKYAYNNNYKGKNPMTRTQWRRYQRQKKAAAAAGKVENSSKDKGKQVPLKPLEMARKPATERIFPPLSVIKEGLNLDEEMDSDFADSGSEFDVLCGVVSILPIEYDVVSEVNDVEEDFDEETTYKPICYYVLKNGCVEEQHAVFERPDCGMMNHLKPLYIQAKVNNIGVNKILVDGGAAVNLMPQHMLKKIGKCETDLKTHNVILTNYEGKSGHSLGAIEVEFAVGSIKRPTLFLVVPSKANYNLLLGREWIHGVGAIPSTVHQRLIIWREDGLVENIEGDQSYFKAEVNAITKKTFDKQLANIAPCASSEIGYEHQDNIRSSVTLHPNYGFIWEREVIDEDNHPQGFVKPTGWDGP